MSSKYGCALRVLSPLASFNCFGSIFCFLRIIVSQNAKRWKTSRSYYLRIISSTSWAYSSSKIATLPVVSTLLYDPGFLILTDQGRPFLPCWIFMDVTADYSFSDFRSPFPVPCSPFPVPRSTFPAPSSPLPVPGSRLSCSPVHFMLLLLLSHSGFSRNTSNGNPGNIKRFPTNKVHFEEKKN